jgi:hypothetical protein
MFTIVVKKNIRNERKQISYKFKLGEGFITIWNIRVANSHLKQRFEA